MRTLLAVLLCLSSMPVWAEPTLRDHMYALGYIMDEIWVKAANSADYPAAADKVKEMRGHLVKAIALVPNKITTLPPAQQRLATIEFQQYMARVIFLGGTLEETFLRSDIQPVGLNREQDIKNLLSEISTAVARAHAKFR